MDCRLRKYSADLINDASCKQACLVHEFSPWSHHGGERSSSGRLHAHPPIQISLVPVPRQSFPLKLSMDRKVVVGLLACFWKSSSLHSQFLCHCPDVIRLKSTAASNVANAQVVSLSRPFPSFPSCDLSGLHREGELWECWRSKGRALRDPPSHWLCHQMGGN